MRMSKDIRRWMRLVETPADDDPDETPPAELSHMVDAAYTGIDLMRELTRQKGSFTEDELTARLAARLRMARPLAAEFARHLLDQFRSMLTSGGGAFALHEEPPRTRQQNMDFLRSLADQPKNPDR